MGTVVARRPEFVVVVVVVVEDLSRESLLRKPKTPSTSRKIAPSSQVRRLTFSSYSSTTLLTMLASVSQFITVASVLAAASVAAQVPGSASPAQLSIVDQQYINSGLASNTNTGFGVPLTSTALLTVQYPGLIVSNGAAYTRNQTAPPAPIVYITPTNATLSTFTANRYVLTSSVAISETLADERWNPGRTL